MAFLSWGHRWNFIWGKENPLTFTQWARHIAVTRFGANTFSSEDPAKYFWFKGYIKDGTNAAFAMNQMKKIIQEDKEYLDYKANIDKAARGNAYKAQAEKTSQHIPPDVEKNKGIKKKPEEKEDKKEDVLASITYHHPDYVVKEDTLRFGVSQLLLVKLMSDRKLNYLAADPDASTIREWAAELKKTNPKREIENAKPLRDRLLQNKGVKLNEEEREAVERFEKAIRWNMMEDVLRSFLAKQAWSELTHKPSPIFLPFASGYESYFNFCMDRKIKPSPPATFWDVTYYGGRLLHAGNLVDGIVGGLCEGISRAICSIVDSRSIDKTSTKAKAVKVFLTWPFMLIDACTYAVNSLTNVSNILTVAKGISRFGNWLVSKVKNCKKDSGEVTRVNTKSSVDVNVVAKNLARLAKSNAKNTPHRTTDKKYSSTKQADSTTSNKVPLILKARTEKTLLRPTLQRSKSDIELTKLSPKSPSSDRKKSISTSPKGLTRSITSPRKDVRKEEKRKETKSSSLLSKDQVSKHQVSKDQAHSRSPKHSKLVHSQSFREPMLLREMALAAAQVKYATEEEPLALPASVRKALSDRVTGDEKTTKTLTSSRRSFDPSDTPLSPKQASLPISFFSVEDEKVSTKKLVLDSSGFLSAPLDSLSSVPTPNVPLKSALKQKGKLKRSILVTKSMLGPGLELGQLAPSIREPSDLVELKGVSEALAKRLAGT